MNTHRDDLESRILQILSDVSAVPLEEIRKEDSLSGDLGMDSVASLELLGMLDEQFGVEVELEEAEHIKRVDQVIELARTRLSLVH